MPRVDGESPRAAEKSSKELPQVVCRVPRKIREVESRILISALFFIHAGVLCLLGCPTSPTFPVDRASFKSWPISQLESLLHPSDTSESNTTSAYGVDSMDWTME